MSKNEQKAGKLEYVKLTAADLEIHMSQQASRINIIGKVATKFDDSFVLQVLDKA